MAEGDLSPALAALIDDGRDLDDAEASAAMDALMSGRRRPGAGVGAADGAADEGGDRSTKWSAWPGRCGAMRCRWSCPLCRDWRIRRARAATGRTPSTPAPRRRSCWRACGVPVVKHGNRAMSSSCGSADVLEALGGQISLEPAAAAECLRRVRVCVSVRAVHGTRPMRHVAPIRRGLGRAPPCSTCWGRWPIRPGRRIS